MKGVSHLSASQPGRPTILPSREQSNALWIGRGQTRSRIFFRINLHIKLAIEMYSAISVYKILEMQRTNLVYQSSENSNPGYNSLEPRSVV